MPDQPIRVLLVEDNATDVLLIRETLAEVASVQFGLTVAERLTEGLRLLRELPFDVVLLDLGLPDSQGLETFFKIRAEQPGLPVVVLTGLADDTFALKAVQEGAQDYLVKGRIGDGALARAIRYALERKRAEQALRERGQQLSSIYDTVADVIFHLAVERDGRYRFASVNQAFLSVTGLGFDQVVGNRVDEIVPEPSLSLVLEKYGEAIREKRIVRWEETSDYPTGRLTGEVSVAPVFDEAGNCTHLVGAVHDITERKQAEAALAAKNEELRAMTQQLWQTARLATMGELAASIAHELNNPLGTVSLRIESLSAQVPSGAAMQRELKVIEQEVDRMGALVANLLQFSRRGPQQISTLDVREEIAKTLELIRYQLRQRQIIVAHEFAPDAPLVQADRQQLRQLFLNLFTNASDAMPEGGTLTIRVSAAPDGKQVGIEVADTGEGIASEDLPKVMEPFYTTKPEGKGTGLGLAICRRIAQEHGGTLTIASAGPGQGVTVRVTLPVQNHSNGNALREA